MEGTLAIVGAGRIGEALLRGLLRSGWVEPGEVVVTARREDRCAQLAADHGVEATTDNRAAIEAADVVLLALKPQTILGVVREVADAFTPARPWSPSRPAPRPSSCRLPPPTACPSCG